jgi:hypothetical protein
MPRKQLIDPTRGSDAVAKGPLRPLSDSSRSLDAASRSPVKVLGDLGRGVDRSSSSTVKGVRESTIALELVTSTSTFIRLHVDSARSLEAIRNAPTKAQRDIFKGVDVSLSIASFMRSLIDTSRTLEAFTRAVSYTRAPTDTGRVGELISRSSVKSVGDTPRALDVFSRTARATVITGDLWVVADVMRKIVGKMIEADLEPVGFIETLRVMTLIELIKALERPAVAPAKLITEIAKTSDMMKRSYSKALRDFAVGEYGPPEKHVTLVRGDIPRVSESMAKEIMRLHFESIRSLEAAFRDIGKLAVESIGVREMFFKPLEKALRDPAKLREITVKTQFTLFGETVRRVVTLTGDLKKLTDIIESSDYNSKAESARKLVDLLKRVRLKLE